MRKVIPMGICKVVKNFVVYGGVSVVCLYTLASCEPRKKDVPQSPLEKAADQGLKCVQDGLHYTGHAVEWLEGRAKKAREYLGGR